MKAHNHSHRREPSICKLFAAAGAVILVAAAISVISIGGVGGAILVCVKLSELL